MYIDVPPPDYIRALPSLIVPAAVMVACMVAYQVASFPTGFLFQVLKWVNIDMAATGPRNIEEGDLLRAGKPWLALVTLFGDVIKGPFSIIAGIACGALFLKSYVALAPGEHVCIPELSVYMLFLPPIAALIGHQYPLWLGFKGGKGFSVALAIYCFLNPEAGALVALTWLLVLLTSLYFSLAAIVAMFMAPLWAAIYAEDVWLEQPDMSAHFAYMSAAFALLIIFKYRGNIRRLINGTEPEASFRLPRMGLVPSVGGQ